MPREDAIRLVGRVVEVISDRLCRVELGNGHRMLAHAGGRNRPSLASLAVGSRLCIEVSPFDFSRGRVVSVEQVSEERNSGKVLKE